MDWDIRMSEVGEVSDGDSVMSATDQGALTCHEVSSLETSVTSQECQPFIPKPHQLC